MTERLTEEEFDEMRALLKRFAESELDQWAHAKARRVRKDHPAVGRCSSVALLLVGGEA
jgi:hypothetical protein